MEQSDLDFVLKQDEKDTNMLYQLPDVARDSALGSKIYNDFRPASLLISTTVFEAFC